MFRKEGNKGTKGKGRIYERSEYRTDKRKEWSRNVGETWERDKGTKGAKEREIMYSENTMK
jgi:hypothetical protein